MPGFLQRFMPHDGDFFVLFQKQAENVVVGAQAFVSILEHYTGVPEQVQRIKAIEHNGDEITHQIFRKLNQTFITPFDTHTITGAIVGVGASRRLTAVRWGVTHRIVWAWLMTIPGAALLGATLFRLLIPLLK